MKADSFDEKAKRQSSCAGKLSVNSTKAQHSSCESLPGLLRQQLKCTGRLEAEPLRRNFTTVPRNTGF